MASSHVSPALSLYAPTPNGDSVDDELHTLRFRPSQPPTPNPHPPHHRGEPELRMAIVRMLRAHGIAVETSVACAAGAADIVTARRDVIFEVKHRLSRTAIYQGLGQLLCYRSCINTQARAILIGYATSDTEALRPHIAALGVELVTWRDEMAVRSTAPSAEIDVDVEEVAAAPGTLVPGALPKRSVLRWNVARLARARGYLNVARLAYAMGVARQGMYAIWHDQAIQVALSTLARLARTLDADAGDWFVWGLGTGDWGMGTSREGTHAPDSDSDLASDPGPYRDHPIQSPRPSDQSLTWNVRARMEAIGLHPVDLAFAAQLYNGSVNPIVEDTAQAVHIETLGKLAQALDSLEHPFSIGNLFTWERETRMS